MKIGVEEEFFIVDPSTLFLYPAAPRIGLSLVAKQRKSINSHSLEFPHSPSALRYPFSIIELKTKPRQDIDELGEEMRLNRGLLRDACRENDLKVLASGSHPFSQPYIHGRANCCAFHIHVSEVNLKKVQRILKVFTAPLITLSANSPFLGGKKAYFCSRLSYSPFVGARDFTIKKDLRTVETRIFDTQITAKRALSLVALITVLATTAPNYQLEESELEKITMEREQAIRSGILTTNAKKRLERAFEYSENLGLNKYLDSLFNEEAGSIWQLKIAENLGFCSLLKSLLESFESEKLCTIKCEEQKISCNTPTLKEIPKEIPYILAYTPFLLHNKLKTYHQKLPSETFRWIKEILIEITRR